jgi:hypothetical protein
MICVHISTFFVDVLVSSVGGFAVGFVLVGLHFWKKKHAASR